MVADGIGSIITKDTTLAGYRHNSLSDGVIDVARREAGEDHRGKQFLRTGRSREMQRVLRTG
jgi:hypothetical protein